MLSVCVPNTTYTFEKLLERLNLLIIYHGVIIPRPTNTYRSLCSPWVTISRSDYRDRDRHYEAMGRLNFRRLKQRLPTFTLLGVFSIRCCLLESLVKERNRVKMRNLYLSFGTKI